MKEIIPIYGESATISNEDRDLLDEMLPLRADAEQLASTSTRTPRTWRKGRGRRSRS